MADDTPQALLRLLQLASPALPVGAYSYSEGLETLVQSGIIADAQGLEHWLLQELRCGATRVEATVMARVYGAATTRNLDSIRDWNRWLSAFRDSEELRDQSWQMGRSLTRLLLELEPTIAPLIQVCGEPCNFAIAFSLAAAHWQIDCAAALLSYLQSWATNLIGAGVKLIPLGQTVGQKLLFSLDPAIHHTVAAILALPEDADDGLENCGWGLAIASMTHETLYSRLFRS